MTIDTHITSNSRQAAGDTARTVLAAGGLLAAFGMASCCALPVALSMLGIGAASLVGIGYLAAPYQRELLLAATLCLAAVAFLAWRQWRAKGSGSFALAPTRLPTPPRLGRPPSPASALAACPLPVCFRAPPLLE